MKFFIAVISLFGGLVLAGIGVIYLTQPFVFDDPYWIYCLLLIVIGISLSMLSLKWMK